MKMENEARLQREERASQDPRHISLKVEVSQGVCVDPCLERKAVPDIFLPRASGVCPPGLGKEEAGEIAWPGGGLRQRPGQEWAGPQVNGDLRVLRGDGHQPLGDAKGDREPAGPQPGRGALPQKPGEAVRRVGQPLGRVAAVEKADDRLGKTSKVLVGDDGQPCGQFVRGAHDGVVTGGLPMSSHPLVYLCSMVARAVGGWGGGREPAPSRFTIISSSAAYNLWVALLHSR